ncbi:hypothetical protein GW7_14632 [Heterocephalus glaber]|uniref:Uncharacterized protein n=1 Tax=Heterocephalus glaber TaxID=10181 RepID=G5BKC5_HETGA|nr:hypothetical protein GW7_14632 [Heterocephalus glaber]
MRPPTGSCFSGPGVGVPSSPPSPDSAGVQPWCPRGQELHGQLPARAAPHTQVLSVIPFLQVPASPEGPSSLRQPSLGSGVGHGRRTRRGEARGAEEGRLPTWGLTPAARQRQLDPGAIKRVHRSAAEQPRLRLSSPAAGAPPPGPFFPAPAPLLQLTLPSDPGPPCCTWRPPNRRLEDTASAVAPGGPTAPLARPGPLEVGAPSCGPTLLTPPPLPSSARCAPGPAGRATLEVPWRSAPRGGPRSGPARPAASGGSESPERLQGYEEADLGLRARIRSPRLPPGWGPAPAHEIKLGRVEELGARTPSHVCSTGGRDSRGQAHGSLAAPRSGPASSDSFPMRGAAG